MLDGFSEFWWEGRARKKLKDERSFQVGFDIFFGLTEEQASSRASLASDPVYGPGPCRTHGFQVYQHPC